jgi:hypothetical protein
MAHISEHHPEEEGEGDSCEDRWIDLLVAGDSVGVGDLLRNHRVGIGVEGCGGLRDFQLLQLRGWQNLVYIQN